MRVNKCVVLTLVMLFMAIGLLASEPAWAIGASPINGGCYIAAPGQCKIHIDPFLVHVDYGQRLVFFQLKANGHVIYEFRTDNSNPPLDDYSPSQVMQDFAATCGETYYLNIIGQDSGDSSPLNLGSVSSVTCPASVP